MAFVKEIVKVDTTLPIQEGLNSDSQPYCLRS